MSDCCRKLHCWWVSWILSINLCHSEDQRWDVETVEMFLFEHIDFESLTCNHKISPDIHQYILYWKMTTRIMFPRVSRHNCISTACCGARAASTCCRNATWSQLFPKNIRAPCRSAYVISYIKLVHGDIYIYIYTYLGYSLPRGYLLYEKRCPFDKVMQVAELAEFSKFYILLPRNSLKYIWWNWKTTIKSSSLPGYTS